jgi:hypothetical protein
MGGSRLASPGIVFTMVLLAGGWGAPQADDAAAAVAGGPANIGKPGRGVLLEFVKTPENS